MSVIDDKKNVISFNFKLEINKIQSSESRGKGAFGDVHPYKSDEDDISCVVKVLTNRNRKKALECIKEIILGLWCDHSCVLPVKGFALEEFEGQFYIYIKMPEMKENLREKIERWSKKKIDDNEKEIVSIFYNLTLGLEYLHNKDIVHNDIKPENILIDDNNQIKIADLGIAEYIKNEYSQEDHGNCTWKYCAPELVKTGLKKEDRFKADIWSLGVVMVELCGARPHTFQSDCPKSREDIESYYTENLKNIRNEFLRDLIANMLKWEPGERCSLKTIRNKLESHFSYLKASNNESQKISNQNQEEKNIIEDGISIHQLEKTRKKLENTFGYYFNFTKEGECGIKIGLNSYQTKNEKGLISDLMKKIANLKGDIQNEKLKDFPHNFLQFSHNTHDMIKKLADKIECNLTDLQHLSIDFSGFFRYKN